MPPDSPQHWQQLLSPACEALRDAVATIENPTPAQIMTLRDRWPAELVRIALQLAEARRNAAMKFGWRARSLAADPVGVQMASSLVSARHKAQRFAESIAAKDAPVLDCCCGIGSDTIALAERLSYVRAIDAAPCRAWMAAHNAGCISEAQTIDAGWLREHRDAIAHSYVHIDPERRDAVRGVRKRGWHELTPSAEILAELLRIAPGGAVKLGPGIAHDEPPAGELEFISERGRLTQAILWTRQLAPHAEADRFTRATLLTAHPDDALLTCQHEPLMIAGQPGAPPPLAEQTGRFIFIIDPAPERAGLLAQLCDLVNMPMLHPSLGLLTADALPDAATNPHAGWLTGFELHAAMPWNRKRVRAWLAAHDAGIVEVKTRDQVVNPDLEQRELRHTGSTLYTVFVLRFDRAIHCLIASRR